MVLAVIVCLSVHLPVTGQSCTKMAKPRITLTTPYNSPGILAFRCQKYWQNSNITATGHQIEVGKVHIGTFRPITGSALALHCCKAHQRINRKMGNSTPCKIVTPENFSSKLCTRDLVTWGTAITVQIFVKIGSGGFSPNR